MPTVLQTYKGNKLCNIFFFKISRIIIECPSEMLRKNCNNRETILTHSSQHYRQKNTFFFLVRELNVNQAIVFLFLFLFGGLKQMGIVKIWYFRWSIFDMEVVSRKYEFDTRMMILTLQFGCWQNVTKLCRQLQLIFEELTETGTKFLFLILSFALTPIALPTYLIWAIKFCLFKANASILLQKIFFSSKRFILGWKNFK